jgi:hypothetical protein
MRITALKQSLAAVLANMDGLLQAASEDGNRDLTAEELEKFEAFQKEADGLEASIKREENLLRLKSTSALPVTALTRAWRKNSSRASPSPGS